MYESMSITVNFKKNICFVHISNNFDGYNLNFYYTHFLEKCNLYFNIFPRQRFLFCLLFVLKSTGDWENLGGAGGEGGERGDRDGEHM